MKGLVASLTIGLCGCGVAEGAARAPGDVCVPGAGPSIADVQGEGVESPLAGEHVAAVTGVVTRVDEASFYIESVEPAGGSTGLRVVAAGHASAPGDCVRVEGWVEERADAAGADPETTLVATWVERVLAGVEPPPVRVLSEAFGASPVDPATMRSRFEALEGMRVAVDDAMVVGPTTHEGLALALPSWGGVRTVRGGRLAAGQLHADTVLVERTESTPALDVGDHLAGRVEGVVVPRRGRYWLRPTAPLPPIARSGAPAEHVAATSGVELSVATLNVARLGDERDRVDRVAGMLAGRLGAPAVVALQEVDGPHAGTVLERLVDAISRHGGPEYRWHVRATQRGPIATALLTDGARVRVEAGPSGGAAEEDVFSGARLPVVVHLCAGGRRLVVVALHLKSKIGDDPLLGTRQPPVSTTAARRAAQARWVARLAETVAAQGHGIVVLGDLNDTPDSTALGELSAGGLIDLSKALAPEERYSHVYRGSSQLLDYVLTDEASAGGAVVDVVHGQADTAASRRDADHDALVAYLPILPHPRCP